ncbi:hypothetical protein DAI22_09g134901 [Oryza sativa Japonica Group]|nr:hypothetical protein DAI22_09g134901 [Oryza sativa Japonica Group]
MVTPRRSTKLHQPRSKTPNRPRRVEMVMARWKASPETTRFALLPRGRETPPPPWASPMGRWPRRRQPPWASPVHRTAAPGGAGDRRRRGARRRAKEGPAHVCPWRPRSP